MAGSCPGVGVPLRRGKKRAVFQRHHNLLEDADLSPVFRDRRFDASMAAATVTSNIDMDETALQARRRLEQKLGYFSSRQQHRSSKLQQNDGRGCCNHVAPPHNRTRRSSMMDILGRRPPWSFRSNNKSNIIICADCLEEF